MDKFEKVLKDLIALFCELNGVESVKLEAASAHRVATVEECMTKEQSMILMLKGLDKEREKAQQKAGFGGLTFRDILMQVGEEEKERLLPLFDELSKQIQMYQEVSQDAEQIMQINLHQIEKAVELKNGGIYTENGSPVKTEHHMTNRRV